MRNIQIVDSIVQEAEELFSDFFQDDKTAYVFTADHGMSNIGNHGDGSEQSDLLIFAALLSDAFQIPTVHVRHLLHGAQASEGRSKTRRLLLMMRTPLLGASVTFSDVTLSKQTLLPS